MRKITKFQIELIELNSSTILGASYHTLLADDVQLIIGVYDVDWEQSDVYSEICICCGIPGCGGSEQLSLRRVSDNLIIFPCFEKYKNTFFSRSFTWSKAIANETIFLSKKQCIELRRMGLKILNPCKYPLPSKKELIRILQWDAPYNLLDKWPNPVSICSEKIYAVSEKTALSEWLEILKYCIINIENINLFCEYKKLEELEEIVFYIGEPYWDEWIPLVRYSNKIYISLMENTIGIRIKETKKK